MTLNAELNMTCPLKVVWEEVMQLVVFAYTFTKFIIVINRKPGSDQDRDDGEIRISSVKKIPKFSNRFFHIVI